MDKSQEQIDIDQLHEKAFEVYSKDDYEETLQYLIQSLDVPKTAAQSYLKHNTLKYIAVVYFNAKEYDLAEEWSLKFSIIDQQNRNYGESEFFAGKVAFEKGNLNKAKELFLIANQKSEGRCFKGEDKKYIKLANVASNPSTYKEIIESVEEHFKNKDYQKALSISSAAFSFDEGLTNPRLHFRRGQCYFELENYENAADSFTRSYMLEGKAIFEGEDSKYLAFLKTKIEL